MTVLFYFHYYIQKSESQYSDKILLINIFIFRHRMSIDNFFQHVKEQNRFKIALNAKKEGLPPSFLQSSFSLTPSAQYGLYVLPGLIPLGEIVKRLLGKFKS